MHNVLRAKKFMRKKGVDYVKRFFMALFAVSMVLSSMPLQAMADALNEPAAASTSEATPVAENNEAPEAVSETEPVEAPSSTEVEQPAGDIADASESVAKATYSDGSVEEFASLVEAILSVKDGGKVDIELLKNHAEYVRISDDGDRDFNNATVTLDLGGYTLSGSAQWVIAVISSNIDLTVKNGSIVNEVGGSNNSGCAIATNGSYGNVNLTLKDLTITVANGNCTKAGALYFPAKGTYLVENCTVTGSGFGVEVRNGDVTFKDCTITGGFGELVEESNGSGSTSMGTAITLAQHEGAAGGDINVTITGSETKISGKTHAVLAHNPENKGTSNSKATIEAGDISGEIEAKNESTSIEISGGTFNVNPASYLASDVVANYVDGTYEVVAANEGIWSIGDKTYGTLGAAVQAAGQTPATITLNKSVTTSGTVVSAGQNITFDLGGNTLTLCEPLVGSPGTESNGFQLLKGSTVAIKNGTVNAGPSSILVQNYCDLTLDNVVLDASQSGANQYVVSNNSGSLTVKNGSSIIAREGQVAFDVYYWPDGGYGEGVNVTVEKDAGTISGTIEYGSDNTDVDNAAKKISLSIAGGTFENTKFHTYRIGDSKADIVITGGTFSADPTGYVETGSVVNKTTDDMYVVKEAKVDNGTITVESSDVVDGATEVVVAVDKATLETAKETGQLVLKTPSSTMTFGESALLKLLATGGDDSVITIDYATAEKVDDTVASDISGTYKKTALLAIDASVYVDGKEEHLYGTNITISLPKSAFGGKVPTIAFYVNDANEVEGSYKVKAVGDNYEFTTTHLSSYVYAADQVAEDTTTPGIGDNGGTTTTPTVTPAASISYSAHIQSVGNQAAVSNGETAGTVGKSLRAEALSFSIVGSNVEGGLKYRVHSQNVGWGAWTTSGYAGTTGKALRAEAIQLELTGDMAEKFDVYYRVHVQNIGWMGWAKNGEAAGTTGKALRIEAIQVKLVAKGGAAPSSNDSATSDWFRTNGVSTTAHVQNQGWKASVNTGVAGTTGKALRLEALKLSLANAPYSGSIVYQTHVQNIGWQSQVSDGALAGTTGKALRVEAVKISLTGEMAAHFDVEYRVHSQNVGWSKWIKNGEVAGTVGKALRAEAIEVRLVAKR
jgi:uncharacterized protein YjdB